MPESTGLACARLCDYARRAHSRARCAYSLAVFATPVPSNGKAAASAVGTDHDLVVNRLDALDPRHRVFKYP